jgi:hypothetical protein
MVQLLQFQHNQYLCKLKICFLLKKGIATTKPNIIDITIDTTEIKIVVVNPLNKNFRFVNPSTLLGEIINHPNS